MAGNRITLASQIYALSFESGHNDLSEKKDILSEWILEAQRLIGIQDEVLDSKCADLEIDCHKALLPCDYFAIEDISCTGRIRECSCGNTLPDKTNTTNIKNNRVNRNYSCGCGAWFYKPKFQDYIIEGCYLKTSNNAGTIHLKYYALPLDEDGYPLIKDNHQMAVKAYILWRLSIIDLAMSRPMGQMVRANESRWYNLCRIARAEDNMPSRQLLAHTAQINNDPLKMSGWNSHRNSF